MTHPTDPRDLLPCPFCGHDASIGRVMYSRPLKGCNWADGRDVTEAHYAHCVWCAVGQRTNVAGGYQTPEEAAEKWNTRTAAEAASREEVERLRGLVERAQNIISAGTYVNWHKNARAALSPTAGEGDHG